MLETILDNLNKASDAKHRFFEVKQLQSDIKRLNNECGSCKKWMITPACPVEMQGIKVTCGRSKM